MNNNSFSMVWWNTSLAPLAKSRANNDQRDVVCNMLILMTEILEKDFIALGEISQVDIEYIRSNCRLKGYEIKDGISKIRRSSFDTCYIYKTDKVFISDIKDITTTKGNSVLKVAQKLDAIIESSDSIIHIFVSHWPSRMWCDKNHADRHLLGIRLRDAIEDVIDLYKLNPHIVLLGDYNDEPFDTSLSEHIMASRDKNLVSKRKVLLYNPFWQHLGYGSKKSYSCGSYFYKKGKTTQWHTFDQIIYSHAFIKSHEWRLNDSTENILSIPEYLKIVTDTKEIFDHLPVVGKIEKVK